MRDPYELIKWMHLEGIEEISKKLDIEIKKLVNKYEKYNNNSLFKLYEIKYYFKFITRITEKVIEENWDIKYSDYKEENQEKSEEIFWMVDDNFDSRYFKNYIDFYIEKYRNKLSKQLINELIQKIGNTEINLQSIEVIERKSKNKIYIQLSIKDNENNEICTEKYENKYKKISFFENKLLEKVEKELGDN